MASNRRPKKRATARSKRARASTNLLESVDEVDQSTAFQQIVSLLSDDPPPKYEIDDKGRRIFKTIGQTRKQKADRVRNLIVWEACDRLDTPKRHAQPWSGTARQFQALAGDADDIAKRTRKMLPRSYDWISDSLDHLVFAANERARSMRAPRKPKASGLTVSSETLLLATLNLYLGEIPAQRRRRLMGDLLKETLGVDVGGTERIRQRLKDYRLKPGRSSGPNLQG